MKYLFSFSYIQGDSELEGNLSEGYSVAKNREKVT